MKVHRPNGTHYALGRGETTQEAIGAAYGAFFAEFGRMPHGVDVTVIELVGVTEGWVAQVFEIIDRS